MSRLLRFRSFEAVLPHFRSRSCQIHLVSSEAKWKSIVVFSDAIYVSRFPRAFSTRKAGNSWSSLRRHYDLHSVSCLPAAALRFSSSSASSLEDAYALLGVEPGATQIDIKKAYIRLAREYHPDVNPDPAATQKFQELSRAFKTLSNSKTAVNSQKTPGTEGEGDDSDEPSSSAIFRGVLQELYLEQFALKLKGTGEDAVQAVDAARKGDFEPAKEFARQRKGFVLAVVLPTVVILRFPALVAVVLRFAFVLGVGVLARFLETKPGQDMAYRWAWLKWRIFILRVRARARDIQKRES